MKRKPLLFFLIFLFSFLVVFNVFGIAYLRRENKRRLQSSGLASAPVAAPTLAPTPIPQSFKVSLMVTGDVMLARSVTTKMRALDDFSYPFTEMAPVLKEADLTLINLESPFGMDCPSVDSGMKFCADFRAVKGLIEAGVDLVSLANNHALNEGEKGLEETVQLIKQNFMTPVGLREPVFLEIKGLKLAFLAYNAVLPKSDLVSWAYPDVVESEIKRFKAEADLLIVYFHWGKEYEKKPMAGGGCPFDPKKLAHLAIDAGADLVLGAHPHVVQGNEWYKEKLIVYSFGNFIFDQGWSLETQKGMVGKFVLDKSGLVESEFLPIEIVNYQPRYSS